MKHKFKKAGYKAASGFDVVICCQCGNKYAGETESDCTPTKHASIIIKTRKRYKTNTFQSFNQLLGKG